MRCCSMRWRSEPEGGAVDSWGTSGGGGGGSWHSSRPSAHPRSRRRSSGPHRGVPHAHVEAPRLVLGGEGGVLVKNHALVLCGVEAGEGFHEVADFFPFVVVALE